MTKQKYKIEKIIYELIGILCSGLWMIIILFLIFSGIYEDTWLNCLILTFMLFFGLIFISCIINETKPKWQEVK